MVVMVLHVSPPPLQLFRAPVWVRARLPIKGWMVLDTHSGTLESSDFVSSFHTTKNILCLLVITCLSSHGLGHQSGKFSLPLLTLSSGKPYCEL